MRKLTAVVVPSVLMALACGAPATPEEKAAKEAERAAKAAELDARVVDAVVGPLQRIQQARAALGAPAPSACDAGRLAALVGEAPESMADRRTNYYDKAMSAHADTLALFADGKAFVGASPVPPGAPWDAVNSPVVDKLAGSLADDAWSAGQDKEWVLEQAGFRAPIVAVWQPTAAVVPELKVEGNFMVEGSYVPGGWDGWLTLWERDSATLLCTIQVQARNSEDLSYRSGGPAPEDASEAVVDDLVDNMASAAKAALAASAPGLDLDMP